MRRLVECVPNFSEGRNRAVIDAIASAITAVPGVTLLDVDPGAATNRTVYTFVGAPEFLIAYNVNLNTRDKRLAHEVALRIREAGRLKRQPGGDVAVDAAGRPLKTPGRLKAVRAIGWYIDEYRQAQVSINLLNY